MSDNDNLSRVMEELEDEFAGSDVNLDDHDVEGHLNELREYDVPVDECISSITSTIMDREDVSQSEVAADEDDDTTLAGFEQDIEEMGPSEGRGGESAWGSVEAKVTNVFDIDSDYIHEKVVLGDETGELSLTVWADYAELHDVELSEGDTIRVESAVGEYDEQYGHEIQTATQTDDNRNPVENTTSITFIDRDITVDTSVTVSGTVTQVRGDIYIQRCQVEEDGEVCGRALNENRECPIHGAIDEEQKGDDLRVQATVSGTSDDLGGDRDSFSVQFQTDAALTFLQAHPELDVESIEDAKEYVRDAMERGVLTEYVEDMIHGEVVQLETAHFDDGDSELFLVNGWDFAAVDLEEQADELGDLIAEARS